MENIITWRKSQEIKTQEHAAKLMGISVPYLSMIENGQRKIGVSKIARISKVTGISRQELRPDIFGETA
jgi:DNA-binding transcriptional regulator YdaS (Cro superfamily)